MYAVFHEYGAERVAFVRMKASTNLIGGQLFSMQNIREVRKICDAYGVMMFLDTSLIGENAYMIRQRESEFRQAAIKDILLEMCSYFELIYLSSR